MLSTSPVDEYARKLSSSDPTPGGGSASAVVGAMGASLVSMVARLTEKSPKFADIASRMRAIAEEGQQLSAAFIAAIDEDVAAFDKVSAAYKLPKASEQEQQARKAAIAAALTGATDPPLRVVEFCLLTARLAVELVEAGNPNAISDAGCAALFAHAAAEGAALNVRINIKSLGDEKRAAAYETRLADMLAQIGLLADVAASKTGRAVARS